MKGKRNECCVLGGNVERSKGGVLCGGEGGDGGRVLCGGEGGVEEGVV